MYLDSLCIGSAKIDIFLSITQRNPYVHLNESANELNIAYGQKIPVDKCSVLHGGNACNVAAGLSKLGLKTAIMAELGQDEFSEKIIFGLKSMGVVTDYLIQTPDTLSSFSVIINFKKDRTIFGQHIDRKHEFNFENLSTKSIYLTSLSLEWKPVYQKTLEFVSKNNTILAFNPGSLQLKEGFEAIKDVLEKSTIVFVNREEALRILQIKDKLININDLLQKLQKLGPEIAVITDGKSGSYAIDKDRNIYSQDAYSAEIVEKTGAGDAYASGFLSAFLLSLPIQTAMKWGTINAVSTMTKIGAQNGLLSRKEMEDKLK
jgi:sugar/nucleoside kinase (ribokinase family)